MPYLIHITARALREIDDALEWRARRSMTAAVRWYVNLKQAIGSLADCPDRCELAPENVGYPGELRQLLYGKRRGVYRILFEIRADTVYILRLRHSAQNSVDPGEI